MKKYLRLDEVALRFGCHPRTVRRWYDSGQTPLVAWQPPTPRGGLRFTAESVAEFEASGIIKEE